jgi:single-stranded-DNA-specific exonuclease
MQIQNPIVQDLIKKRWGHESDAYLSWELKHLPDLTSMLDLSKAAHRLIEAIDKNEPIAIYGDYDVDGTTSCALLSKFFQMIGVKVQLFQPSRFIEGYGLHVSSIEEAKAAGVKVLVTVDCGITSTDAAFAAKAAGIDLIITDHHKDAAPTMPEAFAIINPNRRDENEQILKNIAGVGVAFALAVKIRQLLIERGQKVESLYRLLSYVAIGTISDMAFLDPINLKLCRHGLKALAESPYEGLKVFFTPEERQVPFISSEKISFNIGPMINAKGRLDHPELALRLLLSENHNEAFELHQQLMISNRERKMIQNEVFLEAKEQVLKNLKEEDAIIHILYSPDWHEGVVGIVAAKIVETFKVPCIILTNSDQPGLIKGSARTAGDLNIFDYLFQCQDLFVKFGGHKAAAGLTMKEENLPAFREKMKALLKPLPLNLRTEQFIYDMELELKHVNATLVKDLNLLEPFGMGNDRPYFKLSNVKLSSYRIMKESHVRWQFSDLKDPKLQVGGISFNFIGQWDQPHPEDIYKGQKDQPLNVYGTVGINRFNGNEFIQFHVERIEFGL